MTHHSAEDAVRSSDVSTPTDSNDLHTTGRLSRRTVLTAAAWSTPVVMLSVAAPAAAASEAGFDLSFDSYQVGDGLTVFSADFTRRWVASVPLGTVVSNHGTIASPAGATLTVSCDSRVFRFTGMRGSFGGGGAPEALTITSNTTSGNLSTITGVIPYAIPAGTDSFTGFRVAMDFETIAVYPNDGVQPVLNTTWVIGSPAGDLDTGNDTDSYPGYSDIAPAAPWGVLTDAVWERVDFAGGSGYSHRATSVTMTSTGPNPAVAGAEIMILTDQRVSTAISVDDIQLNGQPAGDAIVFARDDSSFGQVIYKYYTTTVDLVEGDVVTFSLSYTDGDPATVPVNLSGSQVNFNGVVLNDADRRAPARGSASNYDRTGFEATP
ncbi:hypothetical protein [Herbiconiux ginsengi]|uniref:Uncharacterized protein n=1 Tax=Herbiconiux ginsengi TaxID=381665 RepID=A0A1H3K5S9_9MICO|nr:hypothetical protein [Herbiconiux ginsengi]SDY47199.1 hypothetical protein SAMN05216554_0426 [Herbiconiux ginsengi]